MMHIRYTGYSRFVWLSWWIPFCSSSLRISVSITSGLPTTSSEPSSAWVGCAIVHDQDGSLNKYRPPIAVSISPPAVD
jgi:hypothetical protein